MSIENHEFEDVDIGRAVLTGKNDFVVRIEIDNGADEIDFNKDDAIALAKHFGLIPDIDPEREAEVKSTIASSTKG